MNHRSIDAITRDAASLISRRASLGTIGAAGLAALITGAKAIPVEARKKRKKKRGDGTSISRKADQKCAQQEDQCFDFAKANCAGDPDCVVDALRCCPVAGECDVIGFLFCIEEV